jgi:murein endopeptidase
VYRAGKWIRRGVFGVAAAFGLVGVVGVGVLMAPAVEIIDIGTADEGRGDATINADTRQAREDAKADADALPARGGGAPAGTRRQAALTRERIRWRESEAVGGPAAGQLRDGVRLPKEGGVFFTWDPVRKEVPNRSWRLWGTDRAVRMVVQVLREFARENPAAPRVGVGDLSRRGGGDFGARFGKLGHASHQNGWDIDVYYPRVDGLERRAKTPARVDRNYAQDLVDRFAAAGAQKLFVGPSLRLTGPAGVVIPLVNHDDHVHVRLAPSPSAPELS